MSVFIISDIHGYNLAFQALLRSIQFKKTDKLFILGDLIDRGPESKEVLDTVISLKEDGYDIECLMGNHEQMLLNSFSDFTNKINWLRNGGNTTLHSFLTSEIEAIPHKYIEFIKTFKFYIEYQSYIFVHAGINTNAKNPFEDIHSLLWLRDWESNINHDWLGDRKIIHGHSPVDSNFIQRSLDNRAKIINIDNGTYINREGYRRLCAIELESLTYYYQDTHESNLQSEN